MAIYDPTYPPDDIFVKDLPAAIRQKGEQMREALEEILSLGGGGGTGAFISVRTNDAEIVSATSFSVEVEVLGFGELPPAEARICVEYREHGTTAWTSSPLVSAAEIGTYSVSAEGVDTGKTYDFRAVGKSSTNPLIVVRGEIGTILLIDPALIVGIQQIGSTDTEGWELRQVRVDESTGAMTATVLGEEYFDNHPSFVFEEYVDASGNVFRTIPIAYWWRGELPDTSNPGANKWTMLISPTAQTLTISGVECTFEASPGAFKRSGAWIDQFYYGAHIAHNAGSGVAGSAPDTTIWGNHSLETLRTACEANGTGYHASSLQELHEISARAVIEMGTFYIWGGSDVYRGIHGILNNSEQSGYDGYWFLVDGAKSTVAPPAGGGSWQLWAEAGGSYSNTGLARLFNSYIASVYNSGLTKHLFLAATLSTRTNSMIPAEQLAGENVACMIARSLGPFCVNPHTSSTPQAYQAGRLAKW